MARYFSSPYGRRRRRNLRRIHIISALLITAVVSAFIYSLSGKNEGNLDACLAGSKQARKTTAYGLPGPALELNLPEIPAPTSESDHKADALIAEAMNLINAKPARIIDARDTLNKALPMAMSRQQRAFVKKLLSELASKWLFSRDAYTQDELCGSYKVKPGDVLSKIGSKFKVPYEILMEINRISRPEVLRAGEMIKVINGPFHAKVCRSTFTMDLYIQDTFVRSFPVGLGREGRETPTGVWSVKPDGKLIKPIWFDPAGKVHEPDEPDYPLGSRWIGLEGIKGDAKGRTGFAIHGTNNPGQIGMAGSEGCIRMHDENAILMYNLLIPDFSQVEVVQ